MTQPMTFPRSAQTTLDSLGNGTAVIGVSGGDWIVTATTVAVSSSTKQPKAVLYRGVIAPSNQIGGTYTGAFDTSTGRTLLQNGQQLLCQWTGGDAGANATVTLNVVQYAPGQAPPE